MLRILFLAILVLSACSSPAPVEVRLLWQRNYELVSPADMDGDSSDEFMCLQEGGLLDCLSQDIRRCVLGTTYANIEGCSTGITRMGGSRSAGTWYAFVRRDSQLLFSSPAKRDLFVACGRDSLPGSVWDGGASDVFVADLNEDQKLEAIVIVYSNADARPRGVYVLDYATGRKIWEYATGPPLLMPIVEDIDGDSHLEFLSGSRACGNGGVANGTSDESSYVFLVSDSGRTKWVTPVGRYSSAVQAAHWASERERRPQVVAYEVGNIAGGRAGDSVFILDARDGSIIMRRQFGQFNNCGSVAYCLNGRTRLALAGSDETLRVLDDSLAVESKTHVPGGINGLLAGRFSGVRGIEWAVMTNDGRLLLVDGALRTLNRTAEATSNVLGDLYTVRSGHKHRLLVRRAVGDQLPWLLFDFSPTPLMRQGVPLGLVISLGTVLLLGFTTAIVALRSRQTRDTRTLIRGLTGQAGVVEINRRGIVRHVNPKGRDLLKLAGASDSAPFAGALSPLGGTARDASEPRELPLSLPSGQTVLARVTPVKSGTLLTLEDISAVEYMKRVTSWAPVAQKLAHDIKNPLSTIRLKAQQMEEDGVTDARAIQEEVDRLSRMADGFARLARFEPLKLEPKDVNALVRRVVEEQNLSLRPVLTVRLDLQTGLPSLNMDEEQMARALTNLVTNAVAAMPDEGTLTIRTLILDDGARVALEVADTGPGIPEEYLAKLFQPFFTRKPGGTGLGLSIVRKVVEDHRGTIEVESELGKGSTFSIVLPAGKTTGMRSA